MATAHLICGLPCVGKTTYSLELQSTTGGFHFCLDYWLITMFDSYSIEVVGHDEHVRRVLACRKLMWESAEALLKAGKDVILDDGFFWKVHRMSCIERTIRIGAVPKVHYLSAPMEILKSRLTIRNSQLPEFNFFLNPELLDSFLGLFEVPTADEGAEIIAVA